VGDTEQFGEFGAGVGSGCPEGDEVRLLGGFEFGLLARRRPLALAMAMPSLVRIRAR